MFNQSVNSIINKVFCDILLSDQSTPISKLFTLRLFKEMFISGNFTLIDSLEEEIEEHIFEVAQYNLAKSDLSRGANYFSEKLKV